jgi:putative glutamine amidotransferase
MAKWLATDPRVEKARARYERWLERGGLCVEWTRGEGEAEGGAEEYCGLLLTGGRDVDPKYYGEAPHPTTQIDPHNRDEVEFRWIERFLNAGKPIFGICRGIQVLNVALGGGLLQDISAYFGARNEPDAETHTQVGGRDVEHPVVWVAGTEVERALGSARMVNSAHHQAVDPLRLGRGLRVAAVSPMGIIEAVEGEGLGAPVFAVQWHPERIRAAEHPASRGLLKLMKRLS